MGLEFLSENGLPHLLEKFMQAYAKISHTHTAKDVTDLTGTIDTAIDAAIKEAAGKVHFAIDDADQGLNVLVDD